MLTTLLSACCSASKKRYRAVSCWMVLCTAGFALCAITVPPVMNVPMKTVNVRLRLLLRVYLLAEFIHDRFIQQPAHPARSVCGKMCMIFFAVSRIFLYPAGHRTVAAHGCEEVPVGSAIILRQLMLRFQQGTHARRRYKMIVLHISFICGAYDEKRGVGP